MWSTGDPDDRVRLAVARDLETEIESLKTQNETLCSEVEELRAIVRVLSDGMARMARKLKP